MVQAVIATTVTGLQGRPVATTAPTNNQALTWNGSVWTPAGPFLTAAGAPYIATNYCDNSGFSINMRGYTSGTALAAGAYGFDRWKAGASGCTLTFTASPGSTVVTIAAGTLQQVIEGFGQINGTYTLSWLGSATGRVNTGTYVASPISFTGAPNTNVTIEFQGGTLGQVQLQLGTQVTLWQPQPVQEEVARCQRFFQALGQILVSGYGPVSGTFIYSIYTFATQMRAQPTFTLIGTPSYNNTNSLAANQVFPNNIQLSAQITNPGAGYALGNANVSADL